MSTYTASLTLVNASDQPLNGTISHLSGDGSNHLEQPFLITNQAPFTCSGVLAIEARNNHDDFWLWQPTDGNPTRVKKNLDKSAGAAVSISDTEMVVVTSDNGVASKRLANAAAAAV
jgi:hypothetical protein